MPFIQAYFCRLAQQLHAWLLWFTCSLEVLMGLYMQYTCTCKALQDCLMLLLGKKTRTPSLTGQHKNNDLKEVFWRNTVLATDQYFHPVVSASSLLSFHLTRASTPKHAIILFWNRSLMEYINVLKFTRKIHTSYTNSLYKHVQTWKSPGPNNSSENRRNVRMYDLALWCNKKVWHIWTRFYTDLHIYTLNQTISNLCPSLPSFSLFALSHFWPVAPPSE